MNNSNVASLKLQRINTLPADISIKFSTYIDGLYLKTSKVKCPFFRRRFGDMVDGLATIWKFILARHKSLPLYEEPGCLPVDSHAKRCNLELVELSDIIARDWGSGKGYYITGLLTSEIYRNDCLFDGPDPDMPVKGLRKYLSYTSQLFDRKKSKAELVDFTIDEINRQIKAKWRLEVVLNLPWHPSVKAWTGSTTYCFDENNLVQSHVESWDIAVMDAFVSALFPQLKYGELPAPPLDKRYIYTKKVVGTSANLDNLFINL